MIEDPVSKKELSVEKATKIRDTAMSKGLILGTGGYRKHLLKIKPPLIINKNEADEVISIFAESLKAVLR